MSRSARVASIRKTGGSRPDYFAAEELSPDLVYMEGASNQVTVNAFERNPRAREACLQHYGRSCSVCGFTFEARYGEATAGYIHVHHLVPISRIGMKYRLNPIKDLRPVCPNCHAVIHRREPPFSIEEIKLMLRKC
jgi:predicted HNH restriction endonuclease